MRKKCAVTQLRWISAAIAPLFAIYVLLIQRYRVYEIDTPWFLSFSYNTWNLHVATDDFLNGIFPNGMGGTVAFGKIPSFLQWAVLSKLGWTPIAAALLSLVLICLGLIFWWFFLVETGFGLRAATAITLSLGFTEPVVGAAERSRYEPLAFLCMMAALWLIARKRIFLGFFLSMCALECEPAAGMAMVLCVCIAWVFSEKRTQLIFPFFVSAALFILLYLRLHPEIVHVLKNADWSSAADQKIAGGFIRAYFISRVRHVLELVGVLLGGGLYAATRDEAPPAVKGMKLASILLIALSFLSRWPNPAYMIFLYPFLLAILVWSVRSRFGSPRVWLVPAIGAVLILPQYAFVAYLNRNEGYSASDIASVRNEILHIEKGRKIDKVAGDYTLWFAHPDHYKGLTSTTLNDMQDQELVLCYEGPIHRPGMIDQMARYCKDLPSGVFVEKEALMVRGHRLHFMIKVRGPGKA